MRGFGSWDMSVSKLDSTDYWYPSRDSSFILITNFNHETHETTNDSNDVIMSFLNREENTIIGGFSTFDPKGRKTVVKHFWYDGNTLYYLIDPEKDEELALSKIKLDDNILWRYKVNQE